MLDDRMWSMHVLDSWGRPQSGVFTSGPLIWLGAYDQCLAIRNYRNFTAKYCTAQVDLAIFGVDSRNVKLKYGMSVYLS
jgi:hypothetical protein